MDNVSELLEAAKQDEEFAYTLCQLVDAVGWSIRNDWDWNWLNNHKGRYYPLLNESLLRDAWKALAKEHWLSLQTISDDRKISTIAPLQTLTNLRSLVLLNNRISDIEPLAKITGLRYLNFVDNCVSDITPLRHLQSLEELYISSNPIDSLAVLDQLPNLRRLSLSAKQVRAFSQCHCLRALQHLSISDNGSISSVSKFPEMPSLKVLDLSGVRKIDGIGRFVSLTTLHLSGDFSNLNGVEQLKNLTHITLLGHAPLSLAPLKSCYALRSVRALGAAVNDLTALEGLPALREVELSPNTKGDRKKLQKLKTTLSPWCEEFAAPKKTRSPSLEIVVVTEDEFDRYDSQEPYGIHPNECEDGMLLSERLWLIGQIEEALQPFFEDDYDFASPVMNGLRRSDRLILYSLHAYESVPKIVLIVQEILCAARNDWIIYFQALLDEGPDLDELPEDAENFAAWIYSDKILATQESATVLERLLKF
jgi:internalin A